MSAAQRAVATELANEWLRRAAAREDHPDHAVAETEVAYLDGTGHEDMGLKEDVGRAILKGTARIRWFAPLGMAFAQRFVNKSLRQVTAYLTEGDLRSQIQERVLRHLDDDTKIIIGHSLGSVVAYEIAANYLAMPLPLLLTLGSPLGLRTIVYDRVQPQPPIFPALVERWVNIADRNDLVAADLDLDPLFVQNGPSGAALSPPGPSTTEPSHTRRPSTSPSAKWASDEVHPRDEVIHLDKWRDDAGRNPRSHKYAVLGNDVPQAAAEEALYRSAHLGEHLSVEDFIELLPHVPTARRSPEPEL